jgi:two-component system response regulator PilR (NtrC family)
MEGELEVDSTPGVGSEFRVSIPCPRVCDTGDEIASLSGEVLWVDDDQYILSLYQVLLEDWGLKVHTASSVAQAKEIMKHHDCPVVVADLHLGDGDGLELLTDLWAQRPEIEGIIITGSDVAEKAAEAIEKGVRAFLQKPIDLEVLRNEIAAAYAGASPDEAV